MDSAVISYEPKDVEARLNNLLARGPDTPTASNGGGPGAMDIVGLGAALGAGFGAHVVRQAGPVVGGAAIGTFGAAAGGVAAAGVAGWESEA